MAYEFKLPSLGDGISGKITDILVKPGDLVKSGQIVLIVATDKVDAEIPSDAEGTVTEILVKKGDDVTDGTLVLRMDQPAAAAPAPAVVTPPAAPVPVEAAPTPAASAAAIDYQLSALVEGVSGTGTVLQVMIKAGDTVKKEQIILEIGTDKVNIEVPVDRDGIVEAVYVKEGQEINQDTVVIKLKPASGPAASVVPPSPVTTTSPAPPPAAPASATQAASLPASSGATTTSQQFRISPLARKRAKEFGVNLSDVRPSDGSNRVSYKDVVAYVKRKVDASGGASNASGSGLVRKKLPDFAKHGSIERKALSRIGVLTADNMHYAFNSIPHAWISEKADVTRLEQLRQQNKDAVKNAGGSLTMTAIITKAVSGLLKKMPQFNASLDDETNEVIYKSYINIGIAVDTPRGLLVPVLRNCDQKSLTQISIDLTDLSTRTRDGKNKADDLDGGTFTISNIGGIGGTNMLSIVNWPQVAILSIVAAQVEPVWNEGAKTFEPRLMMPMTIGWDHRVINGADAARFMVELKKVLEEPFMAWL